MGVAGPRQSITAATPRAAHNRASRLVGDRAITARIARANGSSPAYPPISTRLASPVYGTEPPDAGLNPPKDIGNTSVSSWAGGRDVAMYRFQSRSARLLNAPSSAAGRITTAASATPSAAVTPHHNARRRAAGDRSSQSHVASNAAHRY